MFAGTVTGDCEQTSRILPCSKGKAEETSLIEASGNPENAYLERKARSAAGQWGRVKELPNGCWLWEGLKNPRGYGRITVGKRHLMVHRLIATIFHGPLLNTQMACHSCNNAACINPKHLAIGDGFDNAADLCESSGGVRPPRLSAEKIAIAVKMRDEGAKYQEIAKHLGVSRETARHRVEMARKIARREAECAQ